MEGRGRGERRGKLLNTTSKLLVNKARVKCIYSDFLLIMQYLVRRVRYLRAFGLIKLSIVIPKSGLFNPWPAGDMRPSTAMSVAQHNKIINSLKTLTIYM